MVSEMAYTAGWALVIGVIVAAAAWLLVIVGGDHSNHGR